MRTAVWNPWHELNQLQSEVNRVFSGRGFPWLNRGSEPAANVWRNEQGFVISMELPGVNPDALDITVNRNSVTIRGEWPAETIGENASWVRRERPESKFERTIELPEEVDPQSAEADCDKGVLTLRLTRPAAQMPSKVVVKRGS